MEKALMICINPLLPTSPHMRMNACRHTHAGLFLGHLASSVELPAELLVQTEVLPLSWISNTDALKTALTAVNWSTINRKTSFSKEKQKIFEYFSILAVSSTCFFDSRSISHTQVFLYSEVAWNPKICCQTKITHSVASIYV